VTTAAEYQQFLIEEFQNDTVTANIARYWALSAGATDALTYLRTRLYILDLALTGAVGKVSFKALDGSSVEQSDYFDHLLELRKLAAAELQAAAGDVGGVAVGTLLKTAPIEPPCGFQPDANDRAFRGDPYRRTRRRNPPY
jgi:hypothetical protein